jgi:hypothetical protein
MPLFKGIHRGIVVGMDGSKYVQQMGPIELVFHIFHTKNNENNFVYELEII